MYSFCFFQNLSVYILNLVLISNIKFTEMYSSENILKEKDSYEIESRISNIILQKQSYQSERVIISDWNGSIHILRNHDGSRLQKIMNKKLFDSPILGMDENRSKGISSDELFIGTGDGKLKCYDAKNDRLIDFGEDPEKRPVVKIISTDSRLFTFTWEKAMLYWDITSKECIFKDKLTANFITAEYSDPFIIILFGNNTIAFINVNTYRQASPLRYKKIGDNSELTKSISCYKTIDYLALGDINGGIKVLQRKKKENGSNFELLSDKDQLSEDFTFIFVIKAHVVKIPQIIKTSSLDLNKDVEFPVNAIEFHPTNPQHILSAGGDYSINLIDIETENGSKFKKYTSQDSEILFTKPFTHLKLFSKGVSFITAEQNSDYYNLDKDNLKNSPKTVIRLFSFSKN